jgi:hypothetical protein
VTHRGPQFSPAPWKAIDAHRVACGDGVDDPLSNVALAYQGRADANLIAAAPELYAQLERAAGMLEMVSLQDHRNAACASRELLAKARGEQ